MKIVLVNNLYYPYNRGGAETVVKKMISDLQAQNHEVVLLTLCPKKKNLTKNLEIEIENALKIYRLPSNYSRLAEFSLGRKLIWHVGNLFSCKKTNLLKKILINEKPEVVITHNLMGIAFSLPLVIRKLNIRHEHYLHDIQLLHPSGLMMLGQEKEIDNLGAKIYQFFTRHFFNSPAKIISPSNWLLKEHKQRGFFKNSLEEIKRFKVSEEKNEQELLDKELLTNDLKNNQQNSAKKNFLFVGQIEAHKGIIFLIESFKKAQQKKPDIFLTIAGDGSLLAKAKEIAGQNKQIKFCGCLDSSAIESLMKASDCLIVPSLCYENSPTTIYEAQAIGLPVIAANIGGIPEIVGPKDKLFVPGDEANLIENILTE